MLDFRSCEVKFQLHAQVARWKSRNHGSREKMRFLHLRRILVIVFHGNLMKCKLAISFI